MTETERAETAWLWLQTALKGRSMPPLLIVIGLGSGDLLRAIEHRAPATRVLALEPDPAAAREFRARGDGWRQWHASGRLTYLVDPDYSGADDAWRVFPAAPDDHVVVVAPAVEREGGPNAVRAARTLKRIVFGARANADARRQFAPRYLTNTLRNAPAITAGQDVRALANAYQGVPAVIAAAGPSLDNTIDGLRAIAGRALLISVDTALRPLLAAGLSPHLAVGLDPSEANARHFHRLPDCPNTWLVGESALGSEASQHFGNRAFWFRVANHEPWPWFNQLGLDIGLLEVWGSVLTAAFQTAILAGCDPIIVVGADLAYSNGRPYCRGTTFEFDWARITSAGCDLEDVWRNWIAGVESLTIADLNGKETTTTPALLAFRDWLVAHAARSGRRVVNATGAGILYGDGIEQASLMDALPTRRNVLPPGSIPSLTRRPVSLPDLAARCRETRDTIAGGVPAPVVTQWAAFSGDGWDPGATIRALDHSAMAFDIATAEALTGSSAPRSTAGEGNAAVSRVGGRLSEAVTRWRTMLGDRPRQPMLDATPSANGDRAESLLDALDLLERIVVSLHERQEDLTAVAGGEQPAVSPIMGLWDWPRDAAWNVGIFEGVLGMTAGPALPLSGDSFYSRAVVVRELPASSQAAELPTLHHRRATLACAVLALEWMICAKSRDDASSPQLHRLLAWRRAIATRLSAADGEVAGADVTLVVASRIGERAARLALPLPVDRRALARAETGTIYEGRRGVGTSISVYPGLELLAGVDASVRSGFVAARTGRSEDATDESSFRTSDVLHVTPRVLTDEGMPRTHIAYTTSRGAVCVTPFAYNSLVVRENGAVEAGHSWPLPIVSETPLGADGVAAWSNNAVNWATSERGYVMYRSAVDAPAIVEGLPFRPSRGSWWRNRLYWTCFWSGVGSWAPGEAPTSHFGDQTFLSLTADAEGLALTPCVRGASLRIERRIATSGWRWRPGSDPERAVFGAEGGSSSSAAAHGWRATAYPEADLIWLESDTGSSLVLRCYYPFTVAWIGSALLVCTADGEALLFEELVGALEAGRGGSK